MRTTSEVHGVALTSEQTGIVTKQLELHAQIMKPYEISLGEIGIAGAGAEKKIEVHPNVMRPEITGSSRCLASFIAMEPSLYRGKRVLDMGCGCGIQGIVMGVKGARQVAWADISHEAVLNTLINVRRFHFDANLVYESDLFSEVAGEYDLIVFNHPFFPGQPIPDKVVSRAMLDEGSLICRFLAAAPRHLAERGTLLMPFYDLAGHVNDPEERASEFGFDVERLADLRNEIGPQTGIIHIYRLHIP